MVTTTENTALALLRKIKAYAPLAQVTGDDSGGNAFEDSDGLISFVNLSSSFVLGNKEFATGQTLCDKVSNFFSTMRSAVYIYLIQNPGDVLPGDTPPTTQWDPSVTNYIKYLLQQSGGFSSYKIASETYSNTQEVAEFSTDIIKLIFDAAVVPENIIGDIVSFIQGVGSTLRVSWDDKQRSYTVNMLGQCHEAVQIDIEGDTRYVPKIKYYYISVNSSQTAFTTNCSTVEKVTFDFVYDQYVTMLSSTVLDDESDDYKNFVEFLDEAQATVYEDAKNKVKSILDKTKSTGTTGSEFKGNNFGEYPLVVR